MFGREAISYPRNVTIRETWPQGVFAKIFGDWIGKWWQEFLLEQNLSYGVHTSWILESFDWYVCSSLFSPNILNSSYWSSSIFLQHPYDTFSKPFILTILMIFFTFFHMTTRNFLSLRSCIFKLFINVLTHIQYFLF